MQSFEDFIASNKKKDEVEEMIAGVWSEYPSKQYESTIKFRKVLSSRSVETYPTNYVIRCGVVPRFVQFLEKYKFAKLQYEAAWILTNIAVEKPEVLVGLNAVPILVKLLDSPSEDVTEQAIWALGNVAGHPQHRDYVLKCGALLPLLRRLNEVTKTSMLRIGTWTLLGFCRGTRSQFLFQVEFVFSVLKRLVDINDEEVLKDACLALWHLARGSGDGVKSVIEAGFVPKLVELLKHSSASVLAPVLSMIRVIVTKDQQAQCVINCGALLILTTLLTQNYEINIKRDACWTISNIIAGSEERIQLVIGANLIPILVDLAQNAEFELKKEAAFAISNATSGGSHDQIKYLVEQGCIRTLCDLLVCPDAITISECLDGLENILKAGEKKNTRDVNCYSLLIDNVGGLEKIENLQSHENNEIYEKALKILETYWLEMEDEETQ